MALRKYEEVSGGRIANITVIIPTTANELRAPFLRAALDSAFAQTEHRALPIVAVNGTRYVPSLFADLRRDKRLRVIHREEPGEMAAVVAARQHVDTEYFGVIDDDDLYLPNAFAVRLAALRQASADAVVTNGFRRTEAGDSLFYEDFAKISGDPLRMLMQHSWMSSAGALFRTDAVGAEFFSSAPTMLEYTYIGLRLVLSRKLRFVDEPTFIKQDLLADAITRTIDYVLLQPKAIEQMMTLELPSPLYTTLKRKFVASCHHAATVELSEHHWSRAWSAHLKSLTSPYGLRYLSFTVHLLACTLHLLTPP